MLDFVWSTAQRTVADADVGSNEKVYEIDIPRLLLSSSDLVAKSSPSEIAQ
jgi:hypothetical protein